MWKAGKWEYVGEVMAQGATAGRKHFEGDRHFPKGEYDYVFDVDTTDNGPKAKLPFNEGDNPLVIAERFLTREGINMEFKGQITDFIRKNTKGGGKAQTTQETKKTSKQSVFPMRQSVFFEQMNVDGLLAKITEFQNKLHTEGNPAALTENEVKYVASVANKLRDPALYAYAKEFSSFEISVVKKLCKWPAECAVPVLDLWRCLVLHHGSQIFFSGVDSGMPIIAALVGKLKSGSPVLWTIFYKFLSNLFIHASNSIALVRAKDIVHEGYKAMNKNDTKVTNLYANYLLNCSSNVDLIPSATDAFISEQFNNGQELILTGTLDDEATLKLAIAFGNFLTLKPSATGTERKGVQACIDKIKQTQDTLTKSVVDGLNDILTEERVDSQ